MLPPQMAHVVDQIQGQTTQALVPATLAICKLAILFDIVLTVLPLKCNTATFVLVFPAQLFPQRHKAKLTA